MHSTPPLIALVTGAAQGIGASIAAKIFPVTQSLVLIDKNFDKLIKTTNEIKKTSNKNIIALDCDVGCSQQVESVLNHVVKHIGSPNVLINNAGYGGPFHRVDEVTDAEWTSVINTNLKSIYNFCKFLLPKMKAQEFGRIINIASVQGFLGAALSSTYVASKHGVIGYTKAIAAEWGKYNINCNAICPGYVDTQMGVQNVISEHQQKVISRTPSNRIARPEEIAALVNFLLMNDSAFINGAVLPIDGGFSCHIGFA